MNPEYEYAAGVSGPSRNPSTNAYFGVWGAADDGAYADIRLPRRSDDSNRDSYVSISPDAMPPANGIVGSMKARYESLDRSGQTGATGAKNLYDDLEFHYRR